MRKGIFITFEGGEGCGKSTHIRLLASYLRSSRRKVVMTLEPGGTELGRALRRILLKNKSIANISELMLFAADRVEHIEKVIKPALKKGYIVLCDRYCDSTVAYQIGGRGINPKTVTLLNKISSEGLKPDLTFLLDLPIEIGLKRALVKTKFEKEAVAFHKRVRSGFLKIARRDKRRVKVIDSTQSIDAVQEEIRAICKAKIFGKPS